MPGKNLLGTSDGMKGVWKMRTLLIASAFIVVIAGPALACRGTTEYPDTAKKIEQSTLSPER